MTCSNLGINIIAFYFRRVRLKLQTMTSQLFWSFLVLVHATGASSWTVRRRSSPCIMRNCAVSPWSSWGACSQPCGTGAVQVRGRMVTRDPSCGGSPCPNLVETRPCNQGKCVNGGTPSTGGCNCRQEFSGQCCTQTEGKHRSFVRPSFRSFARLLVRSFARSLVCTLLCA